MLKPFNKSLYACFNKIRVKDRVNVYDIDILMKKKADILKKNSLSVEDLVKIQDLDMIITKECENKEYKKLVNILGSLEKGNN